jgi:pyrimidine-nucleoside phosphorylase
MIKRVVDLITDKRDGAEHSKEEIGQLVAGYVSGDVADYQMSAWLMAVMFRGLTERETLYLTQAMVASGIVLDWSGVSGPFVDKHSTGGVGDKTSLAVVPILAANGIHVAKLSGRGLGNTGGTLDKLDSIPGFSSSLSIEAFKKQVADIGASICGQTADLVPADKKLYALRDAAGSVTSTSLIAASIMSKKIAAGAQCIVLDVKVGSGAFMQTNEAARELAQAMLKIGEGAGRSVVAILSDMDSPLGRTVGNRLEVQEVIQLLSGDANVDPRLLDVVTELSIAGLQITEVCTDRHETRGIVAETIISGRALAKFEQIIDAQGGDLASVKSKSLKPNLAIRAPRSGYLKSIRADVVGISAMRLGAGRDKKEDAIDYDAGIVLKASLGQFVEQGDVLAELYSESSSRSESVAAQLLDAWTITSDAPPQQDVIFETLIGKRASHLTS